MVPVSTLVLRQRTLPDPLQIIVIGNLHPSEHYCAKHQADYVPTQADTNKDGRSSLRERIEIPFVFYTASFSEEDKDGFHDEIRQFSSGLDLS